MHHNSPAGRGIPGLVGLALFTGLFVIYNSNGRELQPIDSQPTKLAARALARDGVLTLDRDVAEKPGLATRVSFQRDERGHMRSAYSMVPSLIAAIPARLLAQLGVLDLNAPLAPNFISALTASLLISGAVVLVYLALCRIHPERVALYTAIGLGLGTNYWALLSRTLWEHETVAFGIALALWAWLRPSRDLSVPTVIYGGIGLALACTCRLQVAPLAGLMLVWLATRAGAKCAIAASIVATAIAALFAAQYHWFGDPLGGFAAMQHVALQADAHGVTSSFDREPWMGALGLLVSPSRGLLVFSPIVALVAVGIPKSLRDPRDLRLGWLVGASAVLFVEYACYSVWWGGFTFGPRYMLDLLVPLTPAAASGVELMMARRWSRGLVAVMLTWSILVSATGAFVYPNDQWNTDPASVDTHHERLWDWRDPQIVRAWKRGPSPQNFDLFSRAAVRATARDARPMSPHRWSRQRFTAKHSVG